MEFDVPLRLVLVDPPGEVDFGIQKGSGAARSTSGLSWPKLYRGLAPADGAEAAHVLERSGRGVFLRVSALDGVAAALASCTDDANSNLSVAHLDGAKWIVEKCPIPSAGLQHPRPGKHTTVYDDGPDPDEAMVGPAAGSDAEYFALVDRRDDRTRKPSSQPRTAVT